jgi:hypothetical protein
MSGARGPSSCNARHGARALGLALPCSPWSYAALTSSQVL